MPSLARWVLGLSLAALAGPARGDDEALPGAAVVTSTGRQAEASLGLPTLWFPIESRISFTDYVGRYVPGASVLDGTLRLRGGRGGDTSIFVDGFNIRHLELPLGMLAGAEVATAGYGPQFSDAAGGVLLLATTSGANRVGADADVFFQTQDRDLVVAAPTVSGMLVRDHLFFVAGARIERSTGDRLQDPEGLFRDVSGPEYGAETGALKLSWVPSPAHRLDSLTMAGATRTDNGADVAVSPEAQPARDSQDLFTSLRWTGRFEHGLRASAGVGVQRASWEDKPELCRRQPDSCDSVAAMINTYPRTYYYQNGSVHRRQEDGDLQLTGELEAPRLGGGGPVVHHLRAWTRLRASSWRFQQVTPGGRIIELQGVDPAWQTEVLSGDDPTSPASTAPFRTDGSVLRTLTAIEDEVRVMERLSLTPGLAVVTAAANAGRISLDELAVAPRLGAVLDVNGDGRTWLRASSGRRAAVDLETAADRAGGSPLIRRCHWNTATQSYSSQCVVSGGAGVVSFGLPCSPSGVDRQGLPCRSALGLPLTWEHTLGLTRALGSGVSLDVDLVYRSMSGLPAEVETNRLWNASGTDVVAYQSGRPQSIVDWSPDPQERRRYLGVTGALQRTTGRLKLFAAYTWSHLEGSVKDSGAFGVRPGASPYYLIDDPDDRRHSVRALASYDVLGFASLGVAYSFDSGRPLTRVFRNDVTGAYESYRARVGVNPGAGLADPTGSAPTRAPDEQQLNLQLRLRARRLIGAALDLDFYGEAIHLLHYRTASLNALFVSSPADRTLWRLGAAFRY